MDAVNRTSRGRVEGGIEARRGGDHPEVVQTLVAGDSLAVVGRRAVPDVHDAEGVVLAEVNLPPGVGLLARVSNGAVVPHTVRVAVNGARSGASPPSRGHGGRLVEGEVVTALGDGEGRTRRGRGAVRVCGDRVELCAVILECRRQGEHGTRGVRDCRSLGRTLGDAVPLDGGGRAARSDDREGSALPRLHRHRGGIRGDDRRLGGRVLSVDVHGRTHGAQANRIGVVGGVRQLEAQRRDLPGLKGEPLADFSGLDLCAGHLDGCGPEGDLVGRGGVEVARKLQGQVGDGLIPLVHEVGVVGLRARVAHRGGPSEELLRGDGRSVDGGHRLRGNVRGGAVEGYLDDGTQVRLRIIARHGHHEGGAVLVEIEGTVGTVHGHGAHVATNAGKRQCLAGAPQLGEEVEVVALGHHLAPVGGGEPRRARSGDGVGMTRHPLADLGDDSGIEGVDRAVTLRADVVGKLAARCDRADEVVDQLAFLVALRAIVAVRPRAVAPAGRVDRANRLPRAHVEVRGHRVVAADLEVTGLVPHTRVDHRVGLELVDPLGHALRLLRGGAAHVEPQFGDRAVVGEELGQLWLDDGRHQFLIDGVDVAVGLRGLLRPIDDREVEGELDAELVALGGQLLHRVLAVVGLLDDVVVGRLRVPHREAVVVLRRDHQVLHTRVVDCLADGGGVEVRGQVLGLEQVVVGGDFLPGLDLLGVAHCLPVAVVVAAVDGVDAEVHEHAVLEFLPLGDLGGGAQWYSCGDAGRRWCCVGKTRGAHGCEHQCRSDRATGKHSLEVHGVSFQGVMVDDSVRPQR